jgi:hypothetical protein
LPARRVFRRKQQVDAMSPFQWRFFLAQTIADFDRMAAAQGDDGSMFFALFYADLWRDLYKQHRDEIESEWKRRHWTREQKQFVMTGYFERHITLAHDRRRDLEMDLWQKFQACEGWRQESFAEYVKRNLEDLHER